MPPSIRDEILPPGDPALAKGWWYRLLDVEQWSIPFVGRPPEWHSQYLSLVHVPGTNRSILTARPGYTWDGASVPLLKNFRWWQKLSRAARKGSRRHDELYQLMREGVLPQSARAYADKVLRDEMAADGMSFPRRWLWWGAVRLGAGWAARRTK